MTLTKPIIALPGPGGNPLNHRRAFSLVEVLIAVTLMSIIVLGLMAMFGQTQRAFRMGITQVDVMESGRAALEMMAREIEQANAADLSGSINFYVGPDVGVPNPYVLLQQLPGSNEERTNILQNILFTTREGQEWTGIGYAVLHTNYIGTLYRFETNASHIESDKVAALSQQAFFARSSRVIDGVVHLRVRAYDSLGQLLSPDYTFKTLPLHQVDLKWGGRADDIWCSFKSNALPAYVEIELGILEAKTAERARAIGEGSLGAQYNFLTKQVGHVQVFRQRVPIRNVDPSVYQ